MNMKSIFIILKSISIACVFVLCVCGYINYYSQPENSKQRWLQSEGPIDPELETAVMDRLFEFPQALAKNMIIKDITMDTASMLTVAPSGIAILVIWLETPISSSIHCLLIGIVAELEQVPNAFSAAGMIALKKRIGLSLPRILTDRPYTRKAKPKNAT